MDSVLTIAEFYKMFSPQRDSSALLHDPLSSFVTVCELKGSYVLQNSNFTRNNECMQMGIFFTVLLLLCPFSKRPAILYVCFMYEYLYVHFFCLVTFLDQKDPWYTMHHCFLSL